MTQRTHVEATYNGDGLRMSRTLGASTVSYTWDVAGGLPAILQDSAGNTYVYGLDLISRTDSGGAQEYELTDGLGSTTGIADGSKTVVATYQYDAFGAVRAQTGSSANEFKFTGEQVDSSSLQYLRARYYDQATGRFLSKDPVEFLQRYAYAQNNPVNLTDPSGEFVALALILIAENPELTVALAIAVYYGGLCVAAAVDDGNLNACSGILDLITELAESVGRGAQRTWEGVHNVFAEEAGEAAKEIAGYEMSDHALKQQKDPAREVMNRSRPLSRVRSNILRRTRLAGRSLRPREQYDCGNGRQEDCHGQTGQTQQHNQVRT